MAENNTNRTVMLLAGAVVVLLIAFVAVVMLNTGSAAVPTAAGPTATTPGAATATATSNPGMAPSTTFDKSTATKVAAGESPKSFVSAYYQAILDKKYDVAFKLQPAASQAGTVADFKSTQEMYGMKAFTIFSDTTGSTEATVVVRQDLGTNGVWNATWTFVKDGSDWLVKARKIGMGEPAK